MQTTSLSNATVWPRWIRRRSVSLRAVALTAVAATAIATPAAHANSSARYNPDALLQVDLNRGAVIEKVIALWGREIPAAQIESFKSKLMGLRADQLLAANLSGSFDGVLEVINSREISPKLLLNPFNSAPQVFEVAPISDIAKALGDTAIDLVYTPITPCNLMDTRSGVSPAPPIGGPSLASGYAIRNIQVTGNCTIPAGAQAVSAQFTIENIPSAGGVVFAGKTGGTASSAVVSWSVPANYGSGASAIPLSAAGQMQLQSAGSTHIKVDINGYFKAPGGVIGDITEITTAAAGSGLTGGSTSGVAALAIALTYKLPQACANGQVAKFNSASTLWECQNDLQGTGAGGTGTVTNIATGSGLTGGPITTTGAIGLAGTQLLPTTACAANQIAKWNGSAWACAADNTSAGATNAWTQGGNAFGAPGVIGTTDAQPLTVRSGGDAINLLTGNGDGLRVTQAAGATFASPNVVNGSGFNSVDANVIGATIAGGGAHRPGTNLVISNWIAANNASIGGGINNHALGIESTIAGGSFNAARAYAAVGGGTANSAEGEGSTVGGGRANSAQAVGSVVTGGGQNSIDCFEPSTGTFTRFCGNRAGASFSVVGGGLGNQAQGQYSVVAGGAVNTATSYTSTVSGGQANFANGELSVVAGGNNNRASGEHSVVSGGDSNSSGGIGSSVLGGGLNIASGHNSSVAGGYANTASGQNSFAAGRSALANGSKCAVFSFWSTDTTYGCGGAANTIKIGADKGLVLDFNTQDGSGNGTNWIKFGNFETGKIIATQSGAYLSFGGVWTPSSDRNKKENFRSIDTRQILKKVLALPVTTWNYIAEGGKIKRIGPMAQDFHAAFGLGIDDKGIGTIDAQGVALAAIQGLNQKLDAESVRSKAKDSRIVAQGAEIAALKLANDAVQRELASIKKKLGL